jgi:hypothetical protein
MQGTVLTQTLDQRELLIYLPPTYKTSVCRYPVAYVHDRGDVFDPESHDTLLQLESMFQRGELPEVILVGIAPMERKDEYTPWFAPNLSEARGYGDFGGQGEAYLQFIVEVCKPYMDQEFRTDRRREATGLIGKSLGGLISMYGACLYPNVFGSIGSISGSYWYEGFVEFMVEQPMYHPAQRIYMDVGTLEGGNKDTMQKYMVPRTRALHTILQAKGYGEDRLQFVIDEGADHARLSFVKRFPGALKWMFGGHDHSLSSEEKVSIPRTTRWTIPSQDGHSAYQIFVYVPHEQPPSSGYPVIYHVDGNSVFGTMVEAMRLQSRRPEATGVEPAVIVGIGYETEEPFHPSRFYDLSLPTPAEELPKSRDGKPWPELGGAAVFQRFIEQKVKPLVEGNYPIDTRKQTLFGHSFGGLFVLHALFTRSDMFTAYVAGSPSIHWAKRLLLEAEQQFAIALAQHPRQVKLLIGIGEQETGHNMLDHAKELAERLSALREDGLQVECNVFEGEDHTSVLPILISRAIRFAKA